MPVEEPAETSTHYDPSLTYTPPVGRLPVLGKVRAEVDVLRFSASKSGAELALLNQKTVTELAQTANYIPAGIGHNVTTDVEGVIEKQKNLFQKQTDGFDRDAEQKIAKIFADTWSVRQTTDGADAGFAGLGEIEVRQVLDNAREGIDMSTALPLDGVPDAFVLAAQIDVALSTLIVSNAVVVAGIESPAFAIVTIVGGTYSIDGGAYTSAAGRITLGQSITVELLSSSLYSTQTDATLTIGGVSDIFSVTTIA